MGAGWRKLQAESSKDKTRIKEDAFFARQLAVLFVTRFTMERIDIYRNWRVFDLTEHVAEPV
jgi:hypothetical protein